MIGELKRVRFKKGYQKKFFFDSRKDINLSWKDFSNKLGIRFGTLRSYTNELCSIPFKTFKDISKMSGLDNDRTLEKYKGEVYTLSISDLPFQMGYGFGVRRTTIKEIKLENVKQIRLDTKNIVFSSFDNEKGITLPKRLDENLAEEIGIHLGDGFLSDKRHDFRVKGDRNNETEYYDIYLKELYKRLYNIELMNKDYGDSYGFEIYSKALWAFKTQTLEIPPGKKDTIRVPRLIRKAGANIHCAFLRGIMDTDGSIVFRLQHTHTRYYPAISVTCKSELLARDIHRLLNGIGFAAKLYRKSNGFWDVYLYGYANYDLYMKRIGWRNPKNLKKVRERDALMAAVV